MLNVLLIGIILILLFCPGIRFLALLALIFYMIKYGGLKWVVDGIKLFFHWWKLFYEHSSFGKFITWISILLLVQCGVLLLAGIYLLIVFNI